MATQFPIPPTYTLPFTKSPDTGEYLFSPIWLQWFLDLARILSIAGVTPSGFDHQALGNLQGGNTSERYHLSNVELGSLFNGPSQAAVPNVPPASPFVYQGSGTYTQLFIFTGGTGVTLEYSRDNSTFYAINGNWAVVGRGHYIRVTWATAPTRIAISL